MWCGIPLSGSVKTWRSASSPSAVLPSARSSSPRAERRESRVVAAAEEVGVGLGERRLEPGAPLRVARLAEPLRGAIRERRLPQVAAGRRASPVLARRRVVSDLGL